MPAGRAVAKDKLHTYVAVYWFHTGYPTPACFKIEQYTKETLRKYFRRHLNSGRVVYKEADLADSWNSRFMKEYRLRTDAADPINRHYVVVALVSNDREVKYKKLPAVLQLWMNRNDFCAYLKEEVEAYLQETYLEPY